MSIATPPLQSGVLSRVGLPNPLPLLRRAEACFERTGEYDPDARLPQQARRITAACMGVWRVRDLTDDAVLLVSELVTNAFQHGAGTTVQVRLYLTERYVCIEVRSGYVDGVEVKGAADVDESGRGLHLVSRIADDWSVTSDHAGLWCTLPIVSVGDPR
ncbi:ATP-binding protein [Streptomyces sp. NPDC046161]|uniref:ATP-binding protein n=1 Tax=Streptomyces sp. NPDC046161 TaxID=3155132 RepID=UPI0033EC53DB